MLTTDAVLNKKGGGGKFCLLITSDLGEDNPSSKIL